MSPVDTWILKKFLGLGLTTLIILNEEIEDIMKIVKFLKESSLLVKSVNETIENKVKEKKSDFLRML